MDELNDIISSINDIAWGAPMQAALGVTGVLLTLGLGFMPWRKIGYAFKLLVTKEPQDHEGDISPFKALMTALSATVGTGNLAGVATAIALGGPGAIFYMWVFALFGMATKYAEAVCAVTYREKDEDGKHVGGPMYYLRNGVGEFAPGLGKWMGGLFALFGSIAAFGTGNAIQTNSMALVLLENFAIPTWITGIIVAVLVGLVIFGGINRIADVAGRLVPIMIVIYVGVALTILILNITAIPDAILLIIQHAFNPAAAVGGFAGATVAAAVRFGVARGILSNESGLGSAAIAHAAAKTNNPVRQGLIAMLGTFIDTLIVCTATAVIILISGAWQLKDADDAGLTGSVLTSTAFANSIPGGEYVVTFALLVFAFTTIIGWSYYGERCWQYLFPKKTVIFYRTAWLLSLLVFANLKIGLVWNITDTMNGLMALPNLIGLLLLSSVVFKVSKDYFADKAPPAPTPVPPS